MSHLSTTSFSLYIPSDLILYKANPADDERDVVSVMGDRLRRRRCLPNLFISTAFLFSLLFFSSSSSSSSVLEDNTALKD